MIRCAAHTLFAVVALATTSCSDQVVIYDYDSDGYPDDVDCDSRDPTIHPDAEEIPYDGIDQDCDEADLTDVDGDGHDASDTGGDDCDDEDPTVSPSADEDCEDGLDNDCDGVADGADEDCAEGDDDDSAGDDDDTGSAGGDDDSWGGAGDEAGCECHSGGSARPLALALPVLLLGWLRSRR